MEALSQLAHAPTTHRAYATSLRWWRRFCKLAGIDPTDLAQSSETDISQALAGFALYLLGGLSDLEPSDVARPAVGSISTVNNYLAALGTWYADEGLMPSPSELRKRANKGGLARIRKVLAKRHPSGSTSLPVSLRIVEAVAAKALSGKPLTHWAHTMDLRPPLLAGLAWLSLRALLWISELTGTAPHQEANEVRTGRALGWDTVEFVAFRHIATLGPPAPRSRGASPSSSKISFFIICTFCRTNNSTCLGIVST